MNTALVKKLIWKDWELHRNIIILYGVFSLLCLGLVAYPSEVAFGVGSILLITVIISLGIHMVMSNVMGERNGQTLPFIMSLPIGVKEYTASKLIGSLLIFAAPWLLGVLAACALILTRPTLPDGLLPYVVVMLTALLVNACLLLGVSLVTESLSGTIIAIVIGNLGFQAFLFWASKLPELTRNVHADLVIWNPTTLALLVGEGLAMIVILGLTFWFQARKKDFT